MHFHRRPITSLAEQLTQTHWGFFFCVENFFAVPRPNSQASSCGGNILRLSRERCQLTMNFPLCSIPTVICHRLTEGPRPGGPAVVGPASPGRKSTALSQQELSCRPAVSAGGSFRGPEALGPSGADAGLSEARSAAAAKCGILNAGRVRRVEARRFRRASETARESAGGS